MNTTDASTPRAVLVWDAPVRVFHWLLALCFFGAWLTGDSERWRLLHITFGYTVAGLVVFRLLWGLVGTRYARFAAFVRGPAAVGRYLGSLLSGRPEHHLGHNPAGAVAIIALMLLALVTAATGWVGDAGLWGDWVTELHEGSASAMLAVVGLHVAGVVAGSWLHGENLVAAMLTGRKRGRAKAGIRSARRAVAVFLIAAVGGFWWVQWQSASDSAQLDRPRVFQHHDHDDD